MSEKPTVEVVRWYTLARKFPQMIGRTPDGQHSLPFGPYTLTQATGGGIVLAVGLKTMGLWARGGLIQNVLILVIVCAGVIFGLGKLPIGGRNPLAVGAGLARALSSPRLGRINGQTVRMPKPARLRHNILIGHVRVPHSLSAAEPNPTGLHGCVEPLADSEPITAPDPATPAAATSPVRPPVALTGVQSLLAGAGQRGPERGTDQ